MAIMRALYNEAKPRLITENDFLVNTWYVDSSGYMPAWIEYRRDGEWGEYWDDTHDEWSLVTVEIVKNSCGYRCWTSKPDDELTNITPWDDTQPE